MTLTLRIQSYRNQPPAEAAEVSFDQRGGSLGRAPGNELVLDDDSKYISRIHARISWRDGGYYLADAGGNPSVINERPLGTGRDIVLADGDRIQIGEYLLRVTLSAPPAPVYMPAPAPAPVAPSRDALVAVAAQAWPDSLAGAPTLDGLAGHGAIDDPLGINLFGQAPPPPQDGWLSPAFRGAESDHVSPERQALRMTPEPGLPAPAVAPAPPSFAPAIPPGYDPMADGIATPAAAPAPVAVPAEIPEPPPPLPLPPVVPVPPPVADAAPVLAAPAFTPAPVTPAADPAPAGDDAVLQALLEGLGLPDLRLDRPPAEVARLVGSLLREATSGTMDILLARALTKKESRIDMTMISVRSNNPLKFFPSAEGALTQMLTGSMKGYLPSLQAIGSAFDDLRAHEMAVIAGMRAALNAVLLRFDPAAIERGLGQQQMLDKLLGASRKSRLWDRMVDLYGDVSREADDDFQRLFGEHFSAAYEEQVARLNDAGK